MCERCNEAEVYVAKRQKGYRRDSNKLKSCKSQDRNLSFIERRRFKNIFTDFETQYWHKRVKFIFIAALSAEITAQENR